MNAKKKNEYDEDKFGVEEEKITLKKPNIEIL